MKKKNDLFESNIIPQRSNSDFTDTWSSGEIETNRIKMDADGDTAKSLCERLKEFINQCVQCKALWYQKFTVENIIILLSSSINSPSLTFIKIES